MSNKGTATKVSAVLVALGASACCWLPLLLVALGVGATGAGALFESMRPYLMVAAIALLVAAYFVTYRRKADCAADGTCATGPSRRAKLTLWAITLVAAASFAFPYWSASRLDAANARAASAEGEPAFVIPVDGMTCAACAVSVHKAVTGVAGVVAARVEDAADRVSVWTDGTVEPGVVVEAIRAAGYEPGTPEPQKRSGMRTAYIEVKGMIQQLGIT